MFMKSELHSKGKNKHFVVRRQFSSLRQLRSRLFSKSIRHVVNCGVVMILYFAFILILSLSLLIGLSIQFVPKLSLSLSVCARARVREGNTLRGDESNGWLIDFQQAIMNSTTSSSFDHISSSPNRGWWGLIDGSEQLPTPASSFWPRCNFQPSETLVKLCSSKVRL